jgi:hypothetical protein
VTIQVRGGGGRWELPERSLPAIGAGTILVRLRGGGLAGSAPVP